MVTGQAVSHYEILSKLGEGGMGIAYRARDLRLDRDVAIKLLHPEHGRDELRKRRFIQEAKTASSLNHPNIVTIYEIDEAEGQDFIVMEYIPGKSLDHLIPRGGLPVGETLGYAIQVTSALAAAHSAGIVHRDIKPSNIVIESNGTVKVVDFGLAKLTAQGDSGEDLETRAIGATTREGAIVGTTAYMSPEQAQAQPVDTRSDIFSLGVVLYEMLTGRRPFEGNNPISTIAAIIQRDPEPPTQLEPRIPSELERVVLRCLRKIPDRRFQHMADLKVALEELRDENVSGRFTAVTRRRPWSWRVPLMASAAFLGIGFVWTIWLRAPQLVEAPPVLELKRLTFNGASFGPEISRDGKLLAYSDVGGDRVPNVFVRQITGGSVLQITHEPEGCKGWQFSPDGGRILYTTISNRAYEIPALGGGPRLVMTGVRFANYNLDGSGIVYLDEKAVMHSAQLDGSGSKVYLDGFMVRSGVMAPDLRKALLLGVHMPPTDSDQRRWWLLDSGSLKEVVPPVVPEAHGEMPMPSAWFKDPDVPRRQWIVYSAKSGDSYNLLRSPITADGHIAPEQQRLTLSTGPAGGAKVSSTGKMVFSSGVLSTNLWRIPIDPVSAKVKGERENLTNLEGVPLEYASMSRDGSKAAYWIDGYVIARDIARSQFTRLTTGGACSMSPDGSAIVYRKDEKNATAVYSISTAGGVGRKITSAADIADLKGFSSDGSHVLAQLFGHTEAKAQAMLIDLRTGEFKKVLEQAEHSIWHPYFSWDDRWITFLVQLDAYHYQVFIAPVQALTPAGREHWIALTNGEYWDDKPQLSPNGNIVYFTSNRDGFYCVWAQRLHPVSKQPVGAPFAIQHLHNLRSVPFGQAPLTAMELSVGRDSLMVALPDYHSDIWMLDLFARSNQPAR